MRIGLSLSVGAEELVMTSLADGERVEAPVPS